MAVTVREVVSAAGSGAGGLSVITGAGTQATDVMVCVHGSNFYDAGPGGINMLPPSGTIPSGSWTPIEFVSIGVNNSHMRAWWAVAAAGANTVTITPISNENKFNATLVLAGADTGAPISDSDVNTSVSTAAPVSPSVVGTVDGQLISAVLSQVNSLPNYTAPGSMIEQSENHDNVSLATATEALIAAGATGTRTWAADLAVTHILISIAVQAALASIDATLDATMPAITATTEIIQGNPTTLDATMPAMTATTEVVTSSNSNVDPNLMNFGTIVESVAECVCQALEDTGHPVCSCCLTIGQPVSECDCACSGGASGRVSVYPQSIVPSVSWPQALPAWDRYDRACGPPYIMLTLNVEITRCVPTIDESGNPPSCAELTAAGLAWYTDATIVRQAVGCCLRDMKLSSTIQRFSMGQTTPVPEQGGCAGSVLQVVVGLSHCLCPD